MRKSNVKKMKLYNKALQFYCKQLEKALDKACETLTKLTSDCNLYQCPFNCGCDCGFECENKENWKKELMKDD